MRQAHRGCRNRKGSFLEPYPKSLVSKLHSDSIAVEGSDRGKYKSFPAAEFEHFYGISPRRYGELFERGKRKHDDGSFKPWLHGEPRPSLNVTTQYYMMDENKISADVVGQYMLLKKLPADFLDVKMAEEQGNPHKPNK